MQNPFRYFNSSPEVIRLAVMLCVRFPLSLRQVEDLLHERGIDVSYETVRYWWNRFGPLFSSEIRKRRIHHGSYSLWRWHLDEVFVRINGKTYYLWRAVDHEGEVLEVYVHETAGSQGCAKAAETGYEALWPTSFDRHGPTSFIRRRYERYRSRRSPALWSVAQQSS